MKQHYFVVSWDTDDGWQIDDAVADVLDGTIYDTEIGQWTICDDETTKQDDKCRKHLESILVRGNK